MALREALPAIEAELLGLTRLISSHPGEDGSARLAEGPVKPALALSRHTSKADLRERLPPRRSHRLWH